jgi:hypothetical protein
MGPVREALERNAILMVAAQQARPVDAEKNKLDGEG